eukprot:COSAG02_NODE_43587_length_373_cov_0.937956_1_plen_107_part_10
MEELSSRVAETTTALSALREELSEQVAEASASASSRVSEIEIRMEHQILQSRESSIDIPEGDPPISTAARQLAAYVPKHETSGPTEVGIIRSACEIEQECAWIEALA